MIFRKLDILLSSAANLASESEPLLEKSRKWLCLLLLVEMADMYHYRATIFSLLM